ncbi:MAG: hypothetical protein ACXWRU_20510 [Pseudobdellovibrionaceae bacterium]
MKTFFPTNSQLEAVDLEIFHFKLGVCGKKVFIYNFVTRDDFLMILSVLEGHSKGITLIKEV